MTDTATYLGLTHHLVNGKWEAEDKISKEIALNAWVEAQRRDPHAEFYSLLEQAAEDDSWRYEEGTECPIK